MGILRKGFRFLKRAREKLDEYQEEITFAEAGLEIGKKSKEKQSKKKRQLLVIGKDSDFSSELMEYAVDLARRMNYEILALNTTPLMDRRLRLFSLPLKELQKEFQELSEKNAQKFQRRAREASVPFKHVVKYLDEDLAIEELKKDHEIDFVVAEPDEKVYRRHDNRPVKELYVFAVK